MSLMTGLEIGYTRVDITPRPGVRLGGYGHRLGRPSTHVLDPLYMRILLVSDKRGSASVLVQLDILGIGREEAERIRGAVSSRTGVSRDAVMVATTHTHSGPETVIPMWTHTFPYRDEERSILSEWWERLYTSLEKALEEVLLRTEPVYRVVAGVSEAPGLCFNRAFSDGPTDPEVSVLGLYTEKTRVAVVNYACHPVLNTGLGISADYPGVVSRYLSTYGLETVFLTGATGDIDPVSKGLRYMRYMGETLAQEVLRALAHGPELYSLSIDYVAREVVLRARRPERPLEEILRDYQTLMTWYSPSSLSEDLYYDPTWIEILYLDEELDLAERPVDKIETLLQVLRIGPLAVLGVPGEMLVETGLGLKKIIAERGARPIISCYTNDYIGYIPIERSFREKRYEARLAKWSILGEDAEKRIVEELIEMTEGLLRRGGPV